MIWGGSPTNFPYQQPVSWKMIFPWTGAGWGNGFGFTFIVQLISITIITTSTQPQIIRHYTLKVGDP